MYLFLLKKMHRKSGQILNYFTEYEVLSLFTKILLFFPLLFIFNDSYLYKFANHINTFRFQDLKMASHADIFGCININSF